VSVLLGQRLLERRGVLPKLLRRGRQRKRVLSAVSPTSEAVARTRAARIWKQRRAVELESAERFRSIGAELAAHGISSGLVDMAEQAALDEIRHADLCSTLANAFDAACDSTLSTTPSVRRVAPSYLIGREALVYEVVALSCVTETLSTALLGNLVERARDELAKETMHSILRDEVKHSRLGWAVLAEAHASGVRDCVSPHLIDMLSATLGTGFLSPSSPRVDPSDAILAGLGALEVDAQRHVVGEAFECVIFPGLERYGIDTVAAKQWLRDRAVQR
jgi:hypothetical protein